MMRFFKGAAHCAPTMILLIVLLLTSHSMIHPTLLAEAQDACAGLVAPRLSVGLTARVTSGYGLSLKNQPATGAAGSSELALMPYGSVVTVLDGYQCNYGYIWWQLQTPGGLVGWAAEGDSTNYYLEPHTVGLHLFIRHNDGMGILHYFVTPDGMAQMQGDISIAPLNLTPRDTWQEVEITYLGQTLESLRSTCPDRLKGTAWENVTRVDDALSLPLPPLNYEFYPSPDGTQLLLIRHLTLDLPRCDTVLTERVGVSNVSVLSADGSERLLFPYPQHGSVPASEDVYALSEPDAPRVYLDEVVWSPNGKYIAFVAAYQDRCSGFGSCYRYHMYIQNLDTGQLYIPGEGRHVGWTNGGEQINFFRLISESDNRQMAHLYTMRPNGEARQEIWLPGGAVYLSTSQTDLGYPWNEGGTRVMVGNAGADEVMLFNVTDRAFTPPIMIPDLMPQPNRLAIQLVRGEKTILWTTIRGDFVTQDVDTGEWQKLASQIASTGGSPVSVQVFATGDKALIELKDGSAYIIDITADQLMPVTFAS